MVVLANLETPAMMKKRPAGLCATRLLHPGENTTVHEDPMRVRTHIVQ